MPLYDYECTNCKTEIELHTRIEEIPRCEVCMEQMRRLISMGHGAYKRSDAPWIRSVNGYLNDKEFAQRGKQEYISTREQARAQIEREYSDPHPRVQELKREYLDRF
jgi:putative FmdB family regulatory protein